MLLSKHEMERIKELMPLYFNVPASPYASFVLKIPLSMMVRYKICIPEYCDFFENPSDDKPTIFKKLYS